MNEMYENESQTWIICMHAHLCIRIACNSNSMHYSMQNKMQNKIAIFCTTNKNFGFNENERDENSSNQNYRIFKRR